MAALVVDIGYINIENIHFQEVIEDSIKEYFEDQNEKTFHKTMELNEIKQDAYQIDIQNNEIEVLFQTTVPSIFGRIISIEEYGIIIHIKGTKQGDNITIKRIEKGKLT